MAYASLLVYVAILLIRPQEWVSSLYGLPILDWVVGAALVTWLGSLRHNEWRLGEAPQNWLMLGLFGAVLMSHVSHTYLAMLVRTFQEFGKVVLLYFLVASLVSTVRRAKVVVLVIVIGCLFMSVHGILQAHTGAGFGGQLPRADFTPPRVQAFGIFHDPNDLALMLVAALPFLLGGAFADGASLPLRLLSLGAAVPMLYCIYLTDSRGGWLALAVMLVAYACLHMRNKKVAIVAAALACVLVVVLAPSRMRTLTLDDAATENRLMAWGQGNRMLKQWPLFGAGKGRFTEFSDRSISSHNSFVLCWAELGLFGYFFWLGLVIASLKDGWALTKAATDAEETKELARLANAALASLVGFLAAGFFLDRTFIEPLYVLLALFSAFRSIYERRFGRLEGGFVLGDSRYVLGAELLSIPALYVLIRLLL